MSTLPALYHRTRTGAVTWWKISVRKTQPFPTIVTEYGQIPKGSTNTVPDNIVTTSDVISKGKNPGKKNATTPLEQAVKEAQSIWQKKKDKGYSEKLDSVDDGPGYILPMLAKDFHEMRKLPAIGSQIFVQPKLDGIRCIAVKVNGSYLLQSRNGKPIPGAFEIANILNELKLSSTFDGELYLDDVDFEDLMHILRKEKPEDPDELKEWEKSAKLVEFRVFDIVNDEKSFEQRFLNRMDELATLVAKTKISVVPTKRVKFSKDRLSKLHDKYVDKGYEGIIIRIPDTGYEHSRTSKLLKYKEFMDAEFKITGFEEGRGKLTGHLATFLLVTPHGQPFRAKMDGKHETLRLMLPKGKKFIGKLATVKFQNYTKRGVPRFPVVKTILMSDFEGKN